MGWLKLSREAAIHGRWFWLRPLLLELGAGVAVAALYWWEVAELGLIRGQLPGCRRRAARGRCICNFVSHVLLLCLMLAASFIDIDEKIIPDEITVTGTMLGLVLATMVPMSLLPHVAERGRAAVVGAALKSPTARTVEAWWLEPVTAVAPHAWPPAWGVAGDWPSLAIALGCYWLWCFALDAADLARPARGGVRLAPDRGPRRPRASRAAAARTAGGGHRGDRVHLGARRPMPIGPGCSRRSIGLVASGGIVWAVRLIGTAALRREAMGFGDVTLMMMIGTFLGWQACLIVFFLAPFAAHRDRPRCSSCLRRDDVIPYGPFLCLAAAAVRRRLGADLEVGPADVRAGRARAGRAGRLPGAAGRDAGDLADDQRRRSSAASA